MENVLSLLETIVPILICMGLGIYARKKQVITPEQNNGIQQFVLRFCIPCVLFNSCLEAKLGPESLASMAMLLPVLFFSSLWAFRARKRLLCGPEKYGASAGRKLEEN